MRKVIFLLLTATVLLWSCQNNTFTIQGTVADPAFEGANVYLQEWEWLENRFVAIETTSVINGTFTFTGAANANAFYRIYFDGLEEHNHAFLLLERGTINVTFGDVTTVSGTKINTAFNEFRLKQNELEQRMASVFEKIIAKQVAEMAFSEELIAEIASEQMNILEEKHQLVLLFIRNNIKNEAGKYAFRIFIEFLRPEEQKEFLAFIDDDFKTYRTVAQVIARLEETRDVAAGNRFIDFTMNDPQGNEVSLSDFAGRGNYTLVHFWATWCAPCMVDIPRYVELYAKYRSKGFGIVSVSFDNDHDAWVAAIERFNMKWIQMSDMSGWSPVADLYAIRVIPHTVLLDREGIIIANGLRGQALDRKLAELMP